MWVLDKAVITFVRSLLNALMMTTFLVTASLIMPNENGVAISVGGYSLMICSMMSRKFGGSSGSRMIATIFIVK